MSFMQRQITHKLDWYSVETTQGTCFVPVEDAGINLDLGDLSDYCEGDVETFEVIQGYGARLSTPGYMDCTEWTVFDTSQEAEDYLDEYYPEEDEEPVE